MTDFDALLKKAEEGFGTLAVSKKYIESAVYWLKIWLTDDAFKDYVPQIRHLIETDKWELLLDSFYQIIPFGTGGRRELVGIGPNRINLWSIKLSAHRHAQYLIKQFGEQARQRGVVLTFEVRKFTQHRNYNERLPNPIMDLDGLQLAEAAASVYAANGIKVYMIDTPRTTPELSFAICHLNAISGDMFSASHNLPTDNGKKVYDQYDRQLIPPDDQFLVEEIAGIVDKIRSLDIYEAVARNLVIFKKIPGGFSCEKRENNISIKSCHGYQKGKSCNSLKSSCNKDDLMRENCSSFIQNDNSRACLTSEYRVSENKTEFIRVFQSIVEEMLVHEGVSKLTYNYESEECKIGIDVNRQCFNSKLIRSCIDTALKLLKTLKL